MPELPEVETIRRELAPSLVGRSFSDVTIIWPGVVRFPAAEEFARCLRGETIKEVSRRGKYLIFRLSGGEALILHFRMSGSLLLKGGCEEPDAHCRAILI